MFRSISTQLKKRVKFKDIGTDKDMGCDIHVVLEQKLSVAGHEKWVAVDCFNYRKVYKRDPVTHKVGLAQDREVYVPAFCERNYQFFAKLAGVRGPSPVEPKGVPKDASDTTLALTSEWGVDGHSLIHGII